MVRTNIGKKVSGEILEDALTDAANELGHGFILEAGFHKEYMLNPAREEEVYSDSRLKIFGETICLEIHFERNKYQDSFWWREIILQDSEEDQRIAKRLCENEIPKLTLNESIEEYLNLVSQKIYNG